MAKIIARNYLFEADVPEEVKNYDGPADVEAIETGMEEDNMDIVKAAHNNDMQELEMEKEVKEAEDKGASEEEIEQIKESWKPVLEGSIGDFFEKVKQFILNIWKKITAFFKSLFISIVAKFSDSAKFVNKYKNEVKKLDSAGKLKDYKYKGYKFTFDTVSKNLEGLGSKIESFVTGTHMFSQKMEEDVENNTISTLKSSFYDAILDGGGLSRNESDTTAEDFQEELFKLLHNNAVRDEKDEIDFNYNDIMTQFTTARNVEKTAKKNKNIADKVIKKCLAENDSLEKEYNKEQDEESKKLGLQKCRVVKNVVGAYSGVLTTTITAINSTVTAQLAQCKQVFAGAFHYARKQK